MYYIKSPSVANAYEKTVELILKEGKEIITEKNQKCLEILNLSIEITNPKLKRISNKYSFDKKFIDKYTDDLINGSENEFVYTYHERIFKYPNQVKTSELNQIKYVVDKLTDNPNSRRAVVSLWSPFIDTKETHVPCLINMLYQKRDDELYLTVIMRSNDIGVDFHSNALAFIKLAEVVAKKTDCELKNYTHFVGNAHLYVERDMDMLKKHFNYKP